jgi:hypothetical protein
METVSIRDLRGTTLRESARKGKPLAITNHRVLIGVMIPVVTEWVEHVIDNNWSHVQQSIAEGEQAMASGTPLPRLRDVVAEPDAPDSGKDVPLTTERLAAPLVAALAGSTVTQPAESREALQRLHAALNPAEPGSSPAEPSIRTVRIGDVSAAVIEEAGDTGQTLAITHDRELIGIVIPVTQRLVEYLIEQNVSRVLYNIGLGEKQINTPDKLPTLDAVLEQASSDEQIPSRASSTARTRGRRAPFRSPQDA